jgi:hypothetical protein
VPNGIPYLQMVGQTFGRLTVLELAGIGNNNKHLVRCLCSCGTEKIAKAANLRYGYTTSCGCKHDEGNHRTHGMSKIGSRTYSVWKAMNQRCENPNLPDYHLWGGRGITVCERWRNSFEAFLADMGECPSGKHSIDRYPNKDGNYEPGNCRWATAKEQAQNTRRNRIATIGNETLCISEWARRLGINEGTIRQTEKRRGLSLEEAVIYHIKRTAPKDGPLQPQLKMEY